MSVRPRRLLCTLSLTLAVLAQGQMAAAAVPTSPGQRLPSRVSFIDAPSAEKPAAREKRLRRECRGRPNAGMCLGYTR